MLRNKVKLADRRPVNGRRCHARIFGSHWLILCDFKSLMSEIELADMLVDLSHLRFVLSIQTLPEMKVRQLEVTLLPVLSFWFK